MADLRSRALGYVRDGQVRAQTVATPPGAARPCLVIAIVHGHNGRYTVAYDATQPEPLRWSCTCWRTGLCPHIAAVAIWAGSPELAARPDPTPARSSR